MVRQIKEKKKWGPLRIGVLPTVDTEPPDVSYESDLFAELTAKFKGHLNLFTKIDRNFVRD